MSNPYNTMFLYFCLGAARVLGLAVVSEISAADLSQALRDLFTLQKRARIIFVMGLLVLCIGLSLVACDSDEGLGSHPTAVLSAPSYCDLGSTTTLDGSKSTDPDGDIVLFRFYVSDGTSSHEIAGPSATYHCTIEGLIGIMMEVVDSKGNADQQHHTISVRPP